MVKILKKIRLLCSEQIDFTDITDIESFFNIKFSYTDSPSQNYDYLKNSKLVKNSNLKLYKMSKNFFY